MYEVARTKWTVSVSIVTPPRHAVFVSAETEDEAVRSALSVLEENGEIPEHGMYDVSVKEGWREPMALVCEICGIVDPDDDHEILDGICAECFRAAPIYVPEMTYENGEAAQ